MRAALKRAVAIVRLAPTLETISCLSRAGWTRGSYWEDDQRGQNEEEGGRGTYA
jgi:hypothetical protein